MLLRKSGRDARRLAEGALSRGPEVPRSEAARRRWQGDGRATASRPTPSGRVVGEVVLYATGSSARQTEMTDRRPCDGVVMAIVDTLEVDGEVKYDKARDG